MKTLRIGMLVMACACGLLQAPGAHAQWAVVDVGAIAQLVQEVETLDQTLQTARSELQQAQAEYQSLNGTRGMQNLLSGQVRNYLPAGESDFAAALQGGGAYPALSAAVRAASQSNALLSAGQLALMPAADRQRLLESRATVALAQGVSGTALSNASARFAALQQLIDRIGGATDPKAALDLQARIAAEQSMLQNEQTKLQALYQALQAQHWSDQQRAREQAIAGHGDFATRFEPTP